MSKSKIVLTNERPEELYRAWSLGNIRIGGYPVHREGKHSKGKKSSTKKKRK